MPPKFPVNPTPRRCVRLGVLLPFFLLAAQAQKPGPLVVLIGAPAAGKTTQAAILQKELGIKVITADEVVAANVQVFGKLRDSPIPGFDARQAWAMNGLVEAAIRSSDLSKGVLLDGYPATKDQGDYLFALKEKLGLPKALVIHLLVPDSVVRQRLKKANATPPNIEQQLLNYHRELDFVRSYFPQADIHDIDGNRKEKAVAKDIRALLPK